MRSASTKASGHSASVPARMRSLRPSRFPPWSSTASQASIATSRTVMPRADRRQGRRHAAGHKANAMNPSAAAGTWPEDGCGSAATPIVAAPPTMSSARETRPASGRPAAVTRWHAPSIARPIVMIQRSVTPWAARALIVSRSGSKPRGWTEAAQVQPPISATGAMPADTNAHRCTSPSVLHSCSARDAHLIDRLR